MREAYLRREVLVVTVVAMAVYVALAVNVHGLLNWIVGPLWPVVWVWAVPPLVRRVTGWDDPLPGAPATRTASAGTSDGSEAGAA